MNINVNIGYAPWGNSLNLPLAGSPGLGMLACMMDMMRRILGGMMNQMYAAPGSFGMPSGLDIAGFGPGGFGTGAGCGMVIGGSPNSGSPVRSFLGTSSEAGQSALMTSPPSHSSGGRDFVVPPTSASETSTGPLGPAADMGNVDLPRLVAALPASRRKAAEKHFPHILAEAKQQGVTNKAQLAYILATATHESGAGAFMEEFASGKAYEGRSSLGNTQPGDGVRYKGRGYVQLTGRRNYQDWSKRLGLDLVGNPDLVKDPRVAAKILVGGMMKGTFTGKGLGSYINDEKADLVGARRTVNGTDKAGSIAEIARRLLQAMG